MYACQLSYFMQKGRKNGLSWVYFSHYKNNNSVKRPQCYIATWRSHGDMTGMTALRLTWSDRNATVVSPVRSSWVRGGPVLSLHLGCPWWCWWTKALRSSDCGHEPSPVPTTVTQTGRSGYNQVQTKQKSGSWFYHDHLHSLGYRVGFVVLLLFHYSGEVAQLPDWVALLALAG